MIAIWLKYPVITWYGLIVLQTINEEVFVNINKHFLLLRILSVQECINFEMIIGDKVCNFISLYRFPSQTLDDFETFSKNFELNLETMVHRNPFLVVVIGDFNAKSSKWHCLDK